jgi:hypothetical protein
MLTLTLFSYVLALSRVLLQARTVLEVAPSDFPIKSVSHYDDCLSLENYASPTVNEGFLSNDIGVLSLQARASFDSADGEKEESFYLGASINGVFQVKDSVTSGRSLYYGCRPEKATEKNPPRVTRVDVHLLGEDENLVASVPDGTRIGGWTDADVEYSRNYGTPYALKNPEFPLRLDMIQVYNYNFGSHKAPIRDVGDLCWETNGVLKMVIVVRTVLIVESGKGTAATSRLAFESASDPVADPVPGEERLSETTCDQTGGWDVSGDNRTCYKIAPLYLTISGCTLPPFKIKNPQGAFTGAQGGSDKAHNGTVPAKEEEEGDGDDDANARPPPNDVPRNDDVNSTFVARFPDSPVPRDSYGNNVTGTLPRDKIGYNPRHASAAILVLVCLFVIAYAFVFYSTGGLSWCVCTRRAKEKAEVLPKGNYEWKDDRTVRRPEGDYVSDANDAYLANSGAGHVKLDTLGDTTFEKRW